MIHSFLLVGQSNMAGRGFSHEVEPIVNDKILVLRNGRWRPLYVPVNPDRHTSGICLAESFADLYAKEKNVQVGLIPCADGGTSLDMWQVGGLLFDHACYMAALASRTSTIAGVLWHQGEADCSDERYHLYEQKMQVIIEGFRKRLDLYDVPFLMGGLGDFLEIRSQQYEKYNNFRAVNKTLENMAEKDEMTGFVSAEGLTSNPDNLHFPPKHCGNSENGIIMSL
ncbi:MAG: sialate O-acetylesterase [Clostridia bacterium]|nr:sialate O-acetylesterase [Clostridia bacterium]